MLCLNRQLPQSRPTLSWRLLGLRRWSLNRNPLCVRWPEVCFASTLKLGSNDAEAGTASTTAASAASAPTAMSLRINVLSFGGEPSRRADPNSPRDAASRRTLQDGLLPQPGGFEGFLGIGERLHGQNRAVANRPEVSVRNFSS